MDKKTTSSLPRFILLTIFLVATLLISSSMVSADTISGDQKASLWQNLLHSSGLASSPFSVVGDSRGCSLNPDMEWNLANGETLSPQSASSLCGTEGGLFDTFLAGWQPYLEYKDNLPSISCSSFDGCHVQLYCCANAEPSSCSSGETLQTKSCSACTSSNWNAYPCPPTTGYVCAGEQQILYARSSYKYCETADTKTCYYKTSDAGSCYTRTYTTLTDCSNQLYMGYKLYNSQSECNSGTSVPPVTPTCSDGIQNQGEAGIDCGGPCNSCSSSNVVTCMEKQLNKNPVAVKILGNGCSLDTDCKTGYCNPSSWGQSASCDVAPGENNWIDSTSTTTKDLSSLLSPNAQLMGTNKDLGGECGFNFQCASGYCYRNFWGSVTGMGRCSLISNLPSDCLIAPNTNLPGINNTAANSINLTVSEVKKVSLTKSQISSSTSAELLGSACLYSSECLSNSSYTSSCVSIASLRSDGTLDDTKSANFFSNAGDTINKGVIGGIWGGSIGLVACGTVAVLAAIPSAGLGGAAIAPICGLVPAFTGLGAAIGVETINTEDNLIKDLKAKDANSVGICTAVPSSSSALSKYTSWAAFFPITGDKGTDGLIIIFGVIMILAVIFKS